MGPPPKRTAPAKQRRAGRPPDETLTPGILEATLSELAEVGYERLSIAGVARRAGTAKTSVYRRWPNKDAMILDAVRLDLSRLAEAAREDAGSMRADLLANLRFMARSLDGGRADALAGLLHTMRSHPALGALLRAEMVQSGVGTIGRILARAVERGELRAVPESQLVLRLAPALLMQQLFLLDEPASERFLSGVVDEVLLPLLHSTVPVRKVPANRQVGRGET